MKRSPLPRKRPTKRRTTSPRCSVQRCNKRAEIRGWCISHAERRADRLFSRWVRDRDGRCTAAANATFDTPCQGVLQAAHVNGRRKQSVRFDPRNVHALCQGHHMLVDQNGHEAEKFWWAVEILGQTEYDNLMADARVRMPRRQSIEEALLWLTDKGNPE